jgi:hypothetical protein
MGRKKVQAKYELRQIEQGSEVTIQPFRGVKVILRPYYDHL